MKLFTIFGCFLIFITMATPNSSESDIVKDSSSDTMSSGAQYISVDFEVYGRVQGVFFRKYTQKQADKLGLSGWCMNTESGTVQGNMQGMPSKISEMKSWLKNVGSPQSRIDKAVFAAESVLKQKPAVGFSIRH